MVTMKKHIFLAFMLIVFYSCEDNIDTIIIDKDVPPATEIEDICNIYGQVVNLYGVPSENAVLKLYIDHDFSRSYLSDVNGEYCIELEDSEIESYVLLEASFEEGNSAQFKYNTVVRKARFDNSKQSELNFLLHNISFEELSNGDPEDRELISVYGQIVDSNGVGGYGSVSFFDKPFTLTFSNYTDFNGYYEYFVYPDVEYDLLYYTNSPAALGVLQAEPEFQAYFYEEADQMFPEEIQLEDFVVTQEFSNRKIIGQVNYANGDPLADGSFYLDQGFVNSPIPIVNGQLFYNRNSSELYQEGYEAYIVDETNGQQTEPFTVTFENGILDLGTIKI